MDAIFARKAELDALTKRIRAGALDGLERHHRIDVTYTSNAIEGNTLTAGETALVVESGITIAGKPLRDHLEAIDHAEALSWVLDVGSRSENAITEADIRNLHRLVVARSNPEIAGRYADQARFVNTSSGLHAFPAPLGVPSLMAEFARWLSDAAGGPEPSFAAHRRLVGIHPFNDGNGRTARLLMNLILSRAGFPAIAVRPEDRPTYLSALEAEQRGDGSRAFDTLMAGRLADTLDLYIAAARQAEPYREQTDGIRKRS